jgi:hypothetical protein
MLLHILSWRCDDGGSILLARVVPSHQGRNSDPLGNHDAAADSGPRLREYYLRCHCPAHCKSFAPHSQLATTERSLTTSQGYYTPFLYFGATLTSIGAGLLTTLKTNSGHAQWIGYQAVMGLGIGACMQQSNLAAQRVLKGRDVPTGSSLIFFFQTFGGTIFISIGQNVFLQKLVQRLTSITSVHINPGLITETGATELRNRVPKEALPAVLSAYNWALMHGPMTVAVIIACLAIVGAFGMEWLSVKDKPGSGKDGGKKKADEENAGAGAGEEPEEEPQSPVEKMAEAVFPHNIPQLDPETEEFDMRPRSDKTEVEKDVEKEKEHDLKV